MMESASRLFFFLAFLRVLFSLSHLSSLHVVLHRLFFNLFSSPGFQPRPFPYDVPPSPYLIPALPLSSILAFIPSHSSTHYTSCFPPSLSAPVCLLAFRLASLYPLVYLLSTTIEFTPPSPSSLAILHWFNPSLFASQASLLLKRKRKSDKGRESESGKIVLIMKELDRFFL
jgi:hypothetical protein